ncbi:unnamed protein product [Heligmosomoides polygyrus]|uniref:Reverse transcriptase domain-containing protein n=1 Tax=Heligmosomoides polygyrus TaxID=6339 RepID=A0A183FHE0_HELPZ|nr:unnamed protein product [Heligmosomoides polygyrus]
MYGFPINQLMILLKESLACSVFRWSGKYFAQTRRLAMGQRLAPTLAIAFMSKYVDDCFIICSTQDEMNRCFEIINSQPDYISLTRERLVDTGFPF